MEETYLQSVIRRFKYHKAGVVSLVIVAVIIVFSVLAPFISPYDPNAINPEFSAPPSAAHLLGTDSIGRDMLSRLLYGTRVSLLVGFLATVLSTGIGVILGLMVMSFPYILLILVAGAIFEPGMWNIILILGFVDWPGVTRLVRGNVMALKEQDFVKSSMIAGMPQSYIMASDILPNTVAPILVFATSVMAISILDEATLSFLGMGVQPPDASLGNLLNGAESITVLTQMPWMWLSPGLMIVVLVICVNFIGDALRDAMDPTTIR